jgi:hypothetical protein
VNFVKNDLLELAATGHVGAVRLGMPLSEVEALLGPGEPHPALLMRPGASGYPYHWDDLSLFVSDGRVDKVMFQPRLGTVEREAFLNALRQADIEFVPVPELTHGQQNAVRTSAGTEALFTEYGDGHCLVILQIS